MQVIWHCQVSIRSTVAGSSGHVGWRNRVALLVANHSGARVEAELRGIEGYAAEFPFIDDGFDAALTYCDLTTGPDGHDMSLFQRVAEIGDRYGRDHVTARGHGLRVGVRKDGRGDGGSYLAAPALAERCRARRYEDRRPRRQRRRPNRPRRLYRSADALP
jgi:hypothetical protein